MEGKLVNNEPGKYDCWGRCLRFKSNKENSEGSWQSARDNHTYDCDIVREDETYPENSVQIQASCSRKGEALSQSYYGHLHTQLVERSVLLRAVVRDSLQTTSSAQVPSHHQTV